MAAFVCPSVIVSKALPTAASFRDCQPCSRQPLPPPSRKRHRGLYAKFEQESSSASSCSSSPSTRISLPRRDFLQRLLATAATIVALPTVTPSSASAVNGLHIFPLREPLSNNYYLMRACETRSDAANVTAVNPVDKLSISKLGLTRVGVDNAILASRALEEAGVTADTWIWPSVTISAFETAEIVASQLRVRRDRIVPEFSFLDARGVGALEGEPVPRVRRIVHDHDSKDPSWRPDPGEDGTPNDSAEDVFVRVRQFISKLETQYFAENILVVSPDSDTLSIWEAAVTGRRLQEHPALRYQPGEVRHVKELVVDAYGKTVESSATETIFEPLKQPIPDNSSRRL